MRKKIIFLLIYIKKKYQVLTLLKSMLTFFYNLQKNTVCVNVCCLKIYFTNFLHFLRVPIWFEIHFQACFCRFLSTTGGEYNFF